MQSRIPCLGKAKTKTPDLDINRSSPMPYHQHIPSSSSFYLHGTKRREISEHKTCRRLSKRLRPYQSRSTSYNKIAHDPGNRRMVDAPTHDLMHRLLDRRRLGAYAHCLACQEGVEKNRRSGLANRSRRIHQHGGIHLRCRKNVLHESSFSGLSEEKIRHQPRWFSKECKLQRMHQLRRSYDTPRRVADGDLRFQGHEPARDVLGRNLEQLGHGLRNAVLSKDLEVSHMKVRGMVGRTGSFPESDDPCRVLSF